MRWSKPSRLALNAVKHSRLELSYSGDSLRFKVRSNDPTQANIKKVLDAYLDGIGFFLDVPFYSTYNIPIPSIDFEIPHIQHNALISFEYNIHSLEYDPNQGHYVDKELTKEKTINREQIEVFISKLFTNDRLSDAVYHYLQAIEEPASFLVSLYRAYERMRSFKVFTRRQASDFGKLANHEPIWGSRHSNDEQNRDLRYLPQMKEIFVWKRSRQE